MQVRVYNKSNKTFLKVCILIMIAMLMFMAGSYWQKTSAYEEAGKYAEDVIALHCPYVFEVMNGTRPLPDIFYEDDLT